MESVEIRTESYIDLLSLVEVLIVGLTGVIFGQRDVSVLVDL